MSNRGLRIKNPDGTSFLFNENTSPAFIVWSGNVDRDSPGFEFRDRRYYWRCPNKIPDGYNYIIVGENMAGIGYKIENSQWTPTGGVWESDWSVTDGYITLNGTTMKEYIVIVAWPSSSTGKYGIRVLGNSIFTSISDMTHASYVIYKGETVIEGDWRPSVLNPSFTMNNCLCFFYSESPDATIRLWNSFDDRDKYPFTDQIADYVYRAIDKWGNRTSLRCKVVVFGNKDLNATTTDQRYGFRIRNLSGKITFSNSEGVLVNPKPITINDKGVDSPFEIPGVRRPMYLAAMIGQGFNNRTQYKYGLKSYGSYVQVGVTESKYQEASHGSRIDYVTQKPFLFLDAADYFNF